MRLILYALFLAGGLALVLALVAWAAERRLDTVAESRLFSDAAKAPAVETALVLGTAPIGPEGGPNRYFVYRLDKAAALWKTGKVKYLIVSGSRDANYDEPTAMRAGLVARGVPTEIIYSDFDGWRTWDSIMRARDIYGQRQLVIVSQRFHLVRALYMARHIGIDAWGLEARDVGVAYSIVTELRRYPSAVFAYYDVLTGAPYRDNGPKVVIGKAPAE
ncbi:MAG: ElyC/SanA/YdcF family protein [Reyranellaceae bacterium]